MVTEKTRKGGVGSLNLKNRMKIDLKKRVSAAVIILTVSTVNLNAVPGETTAAFAAFQSWIQQNIINEIMKKELINNVLKGQLLGSIGLGNQNQLHLGILANMQAQEKALEGKINDMLGFTGNDSLVSQVGSNIVKNCVHGLFTSLLSKLNIRLPSFKVCGGDIMNTIYKELFKKLQFSLSIHIPGDLGKTPTGRNRFIDNINKQIRIAEGIIEDIQDRLQESIKFSDSAVNNAIIAGYRTGKAPINSGSFDLKDSRTYRIYKNRTLESSYSGTSALRRESKSNSPVYFGSLGNRPEANSAVVSILKNRYKEDLIDNIDSEKTVVAFNALFDKRNATGTTNYSFVFPYPKIVTENSKANIHGRGLNSRINLGSLRDDGLIFNVGVAQTVLSQMNGRNSHFSIYAGGAGKPAEISQLERYINKIDPLDYRAISDLFMRASLLEASSIKPDSKTGQVIYLGSLLKGIIFQLYILNLQLNEHNRERFSIEAARYNRNLIISKDSKDDLEIISKQIKIYGDSLLDK